MTIEFYLQAAAALIERLDHWGLPLACLSLYLAALLGILTTAFALFFYSGDDWRALADPRNFPKGSIWQQAAEWLRQRGMQRPHTAPAVQRVTSPERTYYLERRLAAGDVCDVHYAATDAGAQVLKIPSTRHANSLLIKERVILRQLQAAPDSDVYGRYLPTPGESFSLDDRLVSTFAWREGHWTANDIIERFPGGLEGRHVAWMFNRTLEILGFVHQQGWVHGAVLPPHLLFNAERHGIQLIGWIHAERAGKPIRYASRRYKAWYPLECKRRRPATAATDIYLAAKSMIFLAGGDPLSNRLPASLPHELREFLLACVADSPYQRPQDAWTLHADFKELLTDVYGAPHFVRLHMS